MNVNPVTWAQAWVTLALGRARSETARAHLSEIAEALEAGLPCLPDAPKGACRSDLVRSARAIAARALADQA